MPRNASCRLMLVSSLRAAAALGCSHARAAHAQRAGAPRRPTLVVFLTVDQMIPDYFARYGRQFTGGLRRLQSGGVLYTNGFQDHATTETAPGHAATLSGRFPMHTGIVRNNAGVNDNDSALLGGGGAGALAISIQGTTLVDWLAAADPPLACTVDQPQGSRRHPADRSLETVGVLVHK